MFVVISVEHKTIRKYFANSRETPLNWSIRNFNDSDYGFIDGFDKCLWFGTLYEDDTFVFYEERNKLRFVVGDFTYKEKIEVAIRLVFGKEVLENLGG